mgnify:CR=1 FL=1
MAAVCPLHIAFCGCAGVLTERIIAMADQRYAADTTVPGCDYLVRLPAGRTPRILQLTDMQVIDATQQRYSGRLNEKEVICWAPENADAECYGHIRSLVAQTNPDLIFITGDIVYGEFDDSGRSLEQFCAFMNGLCIPWAPVFGNHDNESARGVAWQCDLLESGEYCLFRRGNVTGNGNYTVGISVGGRLCRVLYMMDSNGCGGGTDPALCRAAGFAPDQVAWLRTRGEAVGQAGNIPGTVAFHIPTSDFLLAARSCGYETEDTKRNYVIGVDVPARNGDFGCRREMHSAFASPEGFRDAMRAARVDGVFVGHDHAINTSVLWQGIRWTYGFKTGQYDYHIPGHMGGTLVTLNPWATPGALPDNSESAPFTVRHVPALTLYGPFPNGI